ncbi:MAG: AMP-binding protein [Nocardioidaceae bacterium]|nr:AMP-binding protein [Nocardioidaceae bacterium]
MEGLLDAFLAADEPAPLVVVTSGSSGQAKQVALSARALRASATTTLARLGGAGQWVLALPAHYVAGLQVLTRSLLAGTIAVRLGDHDDLASAVNAMASGRRYLAAVPTQLHRWLAAEGLAAADSVAALACLDAVLLGGGAASPQLLARARERGMRVVTTYGMSETSGGCVYDGVALDGVAVALGSGGEVRLAGPVLFEGYVGQPDLTATVLRDGWLHTPDLGRFDADGRLVVVGRADDVVVSGGVNIALPAVEARLQAMPGIGAVAVAARPDPEWGATIVAVVAGGGSTDRPVGGTAAAAVVPSLAAVRDFVADEHPRSWAPRELVVVDALPMLDSGKVDRQRLRTLLDSSDSAALGVSSRGRTNSGEDA